MIWNSIFGVPFQVSCGVCQGGILSPLLFAVYVDDLIDELRKCGCGLYIGSVFIGALLYADDIALLACSCLGLQKLINVCIDYGLQWDICFNPSKSQIMCFGGRHPDKELLYIGGKTSLCRLMCVTSISQLWACAGLNVLNILAVILGATQVKLTCRVL